MGCMPFELVLHDLTLKTSSEHMHTHTHAHHHHLDPSLTMPYGCEWSKILYLTLRFLQRKAALHLREIHIKMSPAESNCSPAPLISLRWSSCHAARVWVCECGKKKKEEDGERGALRKIGPMVWRILHPLIKGWCQRHTRTGQKKWRERKQKEKEKNILLFF